MCMCWRVCLFCLKKKIWRYLDLEEMIIRDRVLVIGHRIHSVADVQFVHDASVQDAASLRHMSLV